MKSYTDIEQSKKLAEILPIESADMWYEDSGLMIPRLGHIPKEHTNTEFPCWSLTALLRLIPNFNMFKRTIECRIETTDHLIDKACDPIDAAYEMVCWLKEHNKI